MTAKNKIV